MIHKAICVATEAHRGQVRKVSGSPFIFHPLAVGILLSDAGEDEATVIAGILHDTVEDTKVTLREIEEEFGAEVAKIVDGCSENKALPWEARKQETIDALHTASEKVCIVTCADKVHNVKTSIAGIKEKGKNYFANFNRGYDQQKWYYRSIRDVLAKRIPDHSLFKKYCQVYDKAFGKWRTIEQN